MRSLAGWVFGSGRTLVLVVLLVAAFTTGVFFLWQEVADRVLDSDQYRVTIDRVCITPPPAWVRSDVRDDVFRYGNLNPPLSIMDADLTERVSTAFSLHPWVSGVVQVEKSHPARVDVKLAWRKPVCMVLQPSGRLLPVDVTGVVLPVDDFSPTESQRYPHVVGVETVPVGPAGTRWGDVRVVGGAEIADAFGSAWGELGLDRIVPSAGTLEVGEEPTFNIWTRGGTLIIWGRAPGTDMPGEVPAVDKVARLVKLKQQHGTLERILGSQPLDVRSLRSMEAEPRTAEKNVEHQTSNIER